MSNALQLNGATPDKPTKATPIYVGRIFSGIWTNRSPLRDATTDRITEKFYGPAGDAMIAGSNLEITNRLTLSRRPGNPLYDATNAYTNIIAFDEFRYSKALSDSWGASTEQIDTMVDTAAALYANNNGSSSLVYTKSAGAGQSLMQSVGSQLYLGNGIDRKKWNQSLFVRNSSNNSLGLNVEGYPFMTTSLVDSNGNLQQLIGCLIATISTVAIANNVLTITLDAALGAVGNTGIASGMFDNPGGIQAAGTQFMLWGFAGTAAAFLNGATVTLNAATTLNTTTLTADFTAPTLGTTSVEGNGYLQIINGVVSGVANALIPAVAITAIMPAAVTDSLPGLTVGASVPTWGTTVPAVSNHFQGSLTIDGNAMWVNRGTPTQNWGIIPPSVAPSFVAAGSVSGYVANTYFSPASIYQDTVSGYLWQISTPGVLDSGAAPAGGWPASATPATQQQVITIAINSGTSVITVTLNGTAPTSGVVTLLGVEPASFLDGVQLTVASHSGSQFTATYAYPTNYNASQTAGVAYIGGTRVTDGSAIWTCLQTPTLTNSWQASHAYTTGTYIKAPNGPGGNPAYWLLRTNQSSSTGQPTIHTSPAPVTYGWNDGNKNFSHSYPALGTQNHTLTYPTFLASLLCNAYRFNDDYFKQVPVDGALNTGTETQIGLNEGRQFATVVPITIPAAGSYTFSVAHTDGAFYAFQPSNGTGTATLTGGTFVTSNGQVATAILGYSPMVGTNNLTNFPAANSSLTDTSTWTFTAPGVYLLEVDWAAQSSSGNNLMHVTCNTLNIGVEPQVSGTTTPNWVAFVTAGIGATFNATQDEIYFAQTATDSGGQFVWNNIGLVTDFVRTPSTYYTLPGQAIVDQFSDEQGAYETGVSGTSTPAFSTSPNAVTLDPNAPLSWIDEGAVPAQATAAGKITATSAQGWIWALALVNTLDNTVSNIGPVSLPSGPLVNATPTFAPGSGLNVSQIDPQADYVAIFRTADGFTTELLLAGFGNSIYTVPLSQYLQNGYIDTTPDTGLDTQASAPQADENTPPLPGAINLAYHLNRIWFSVGNTVFWTSGPNDPIGNGINGFGPNNYDKMPAQVTRLVPSSIGLLVFTVSDIYLIPDNNGVILPSIPWIRGVGLRSYNALDHNGPSIGFFTTDSQFLTISPNTGLAISSIPIADQLVLKNGTPGQNWNPSNVYVAHHVSGQDMGWFVADGATGWFRLISTPAPEKSSTCWSPFATIQGGVRAIKSVETSPGVHKLLLGPSSATPTTITNIALTSNVLTVTCTNGYVSGQTIQLAGLTTNTFLNGVFVTILTASGSQFTATFAHGNVSQRSRYWYCNACRVYPK